MKTPHWAAIEMALRSYMADVTGRQKWSPIHDTLHYALIEGSDGERRWHLVHPDAMPALQKLGRPYALHDQLGGELRNGDDVHVLSEFHANRVSAVLASHPELGPYVVKGHENHTPYVGGLDKPLKKQVPVTGADADVNGGRASAAPNVRWTQQGNAKALTPLRTGDLNAVIQYNPFTPDNTSGSTFGSTAEWVTTQAGRAAGAPMVPVWQGRIGGAKDDANAVSAKHPNWYHSENQYASFQPYVAAADEAAAVLGAKYVPTAQLSSQTKQWVERLDSRLKTVEKMTGAPDCHEGNYIDVPCLLPDGSVTPVKHGIDYEWKSVRGLLEGDTNEAADVIEHVTEAKKPKTPDIMGQLDAIGTIVNWKQPSELGLGTHADMALSDFQQGWNGVAAKNNAGDPYYDEVDKIMKFTRNLHKQVGGRDLSKAEHSL